MELHDKDMPMAGLARQPVPMQYGTMWGWWPGWGSSVELARRGLLCFLYVARMYPRNSLRSTRGCEGVFKQREIKCIRWGGGV